jgi:hypothetical protein
MDERRIRRMAGYLMARLPDARMDRVTDPRGGPVKWKLAQLITAVLAGLMAGCKSLGEVEQLTDMLSPAMRRKLKLGRRLPDTTMRDALCQLSLDELRACLHQVVKAAWRRKALKPQGLPFGVAAMDGKVTAVQFWDDQHVQKHHPEVGLPYGLVRTVTCTLVSAAGNPCLDALPIPVATNEMGHFEVAFKNLVERCGDLFQVVTYDAGALSEENGGLVVEAGKDYLFRLKGEQRYMYKLAEELLDPHDVAAQTVDVLDNRTTVTRKVVVLPVHQNWAYGNGKASHESLWQHVRTFIRIESVKTVGGVVTEREVRMYVTSLEAEELSPEQWLLIVRSHWGVESNHHTLDTAFEEDDRPWIVADGQGLLNVLVLRRIAYTLLALYRSVTQRSDDARTIRWKELLRWVYWTLLAATEAHLVKLRERSPVAVWS